MNLPAMRIHGASAEHRVIADLIDQGCAVCRPELENIEYDLIADINGSLRKVQIKSSFSDGKKISVDLRRQSAKSKFYSKNDLDILAVYDGTTGKVAYLNWADVKSKRGLTLRIKEPKANNGVVQAFGRKYFNDYMDVYAAARAKKGIMGDLIELVRQA